MPDTVITEALRHHRPNATPVGPPSCHIGGAWVAVPGSSWAVIDVTQAKESTSFVASCTWQDGSGRPKPWHNLSGTVDARGTVTLEFSDHTDYGVVAPDSGAGCGQAICWNSAARWCRADACANITELCRGVRPAPPPPPPSPSSNVTSYFGIEWIERDGRRLRPT